MKTPDRKTFRCAIYTRKSTEHNLDLEFNSLDAQREACEAYIKSQAHEGWRLLPAHYDDGGLSVASLDRPALQALLAEVQAGNVNIVAVYKVDRLTRSLTDFAKLVELFDQHAVSFVSITQSFNTTSSMGRLTLNVLLSFAQFEREVIGERVRDKIAASKRKGIWVGGPVPLGYRCIDKKLTIVPEEAETVRTIFRRYLELGSMAALVADLDRSGIRTKSNKQSGGRIRGGIRFGVGPLAHLLKNRFYIGEICYRGEVHAGEHEPILDRALFDAVQAKLAANAIERKNRLRGRAAILTGRIYDDRGNRMSPSHSNKHGARYRYYVSHALLQNRKETAGNVRRVPASDIEHLVLDSIRSHLQSAQIAVPDDDISLVERHLDCVIVRPEALEVRLFADGAAGLGLKESDDDDLTTGQRVATILGMPWSAANAVAVKGVVFEPASRRSMSPESRDALLGAIAKARGWIEELRLGDVASLADLADREHLGERQVRLLATLAFVSPRIVAEIAGGTVPAELTVTGLARRLPYSWAAQQIYVETRLPARRS
jgi:site-specific DNA recombinase